MAAAVILGLCGVSVAGLGRQRLWSLFRGPCSVAVPYCISKTHPPCTAASHVSESLPFLECSRRARHKARPVVRHHHPFPVTRDVAFRAAFLGWLGKLVLEAVTLCSRSGASPLEVTPRLSTPLESALEPLRPRAHSPERGGDSRPHLLSS